jgi:ATP-dependent Lon protease
MADNPSSLTLPLLITKGMVLFPSTTRLIEAGRDFSVKAVKVAREKSDSLILITSQNNSDVDKPTPNDVFTTGVLARIISISEKENIAKIRVEVIDRVSLANIAFDAEDECYVSEATMIEAIKVDPQSGEAIVSAINHELEKYPSVLSKLPKYLVNLCADNARALDLCYSLAGYFDASKELKQKLLETNDLILLAETVTGFISGENIKEEIEKNISDSIRESTEKSQKEYYLREKLKAVKKELGEDVGGNNDPDKILEKLDKYPYPENVKAKVKAEIKKYEMMPQGSLEAALILSYLDVIMSIPWWQKN